MYIYINKNIKKIHLYTPINYIIKNDKKKIYLVLHFIFKYCFI
jgi:hypothetical protein